MSSNNAADNYYTYYGASSGPADDDVLNARPVPPSSGDFATTGQAAASRQVHAPHEHHHAAAGSDPSQDFEHLCRVIGDSVSQATRAIGEGLKSSRGPVAEGLGSAGSAVGEALGTAGSAVSEALGRSFETYKQKQAEAQARAEIKRQEALVKARFASPGKLRTGGIVQTTFGSLLSVSFVNAFLEALVRSGSTTVDWIASLAVTGVLSFFSIKFLVSGINKIRLAGLLEKYRSAIGKQEAVAISDLAARTKSSPKKTLGAVEEIIGKGLLPEGRLDEERTTLIMTDAAYDQYLRYRKEQAIREHEELMRKQQAEAEAKALGLTPEMQAFLDNGQDYLAQMRALDVAIQDEAVSAKIVAIEGTVQRILARAKEEPSVIDGLGRLMNYYLPTTVKLLTAYDALEEQTIQGENITSSRKEIEQTLDVLYVAYEKLLDATFENLSMDVSSDITVLHTVLAQEGLVDGPFDSAKHAHSGE